MEDSGIPGSQEVVRQMLLSNSRSTAKALCDRLVGEGFERGLAQLGIQRTIEAGHLVICDNLDIALPNPSYVSDTPRTDRFGRPVLSIEQLNERLETKPHD